MLAGCTLAGCGTAGQNKQTQPFFEIGTDEVVNVVGTEPFWNARVDRDTLTYTTPDDPAGTPITVQRFAGNSGLAFHGKLAEQPLDLLVTKGGCSDGMSDRRYPFTATLKIGADQRSGCAWSEKRPFTGPAAP